MWPATDALERKIIHQSQLEAYAFPSLAEQRLLLAQQDICGR